MADERMPYEIIDELAAALAKRSDKEILKALAAIPPLADENDPCWNGDAYWHKVAYPYLALWQIAAERRLSAAIPLMLERACFGDPGEIMRGLCNALEAIVQPKWRVLTKYCVTALQSTRAGTRMWAADQLQRLRDPSAVLALEDAARDRVAEVRKWAKAALKSTREAMRKAKS